MPSVCRVARPCDARTPARPSHSGSPTARPGVDPVWLAAPLPSGLPGPLRRFQRSYGLIRCDHQRELTLGPRNQIVSRYVLQFVIVRRVVIRGLIAATVLVGAACTSTGPSEQGAGPPLTPSSSPPASGSTNQEVSTTAVSDASTTALSDLLDDYNAGRVLNWGDTRLTVGERVLMTISGHCGFSRLPEIGGTSWEAPELGLDALDPIPPEWEAFLYPPGSSLRSIDALLERPDETTLLVTALGTNRTVSYRPSSTDFGCD